MRTFFNKSRTGKTRVWQIEAVGDQIVTEYGDLGGAMQRVTDTAKPLNVGKANAKTAEQVAQETVDRQILLKQRGGYIEEGATEARAEEIDFDALPINLRFYKPEGQMTTTMAKLIEARKAWFGRKRDGEMFVACINSQSEVDLYSRTMLRGHAMEPGVPWADRFPQIVDDLRMAQFPPCTILLGELVMDRDGADDFAHVERVLRAKRDYALEIQEKEGQLSYYIWDIAFFGGTDFVREEIFTTRREHMLDYLADTDTMELVFDYLLPLELPMDTAILTEEYFAKSPVNTEHPTYDPENGPVRNFMSELAFENGWEGYVVVDPDGVYGDKAYNFRGKTDRPGKACCKAKIPQTDEFVAFWNPAEGVGEYGTGKYQGLIGSVVLYQFNSAGEMVYICECGNGFTEAFLNEWSNPALFPAVFEIKFEERSYVSDGEKTNALRFPRFLRVRPDKTIDECVNPKLD